MTQINFSIATIDQDGNKTSFTGVFPSPAFPTPLSLIKALADQIGEDTNTTFKVKVDEKKALKELGY